jgi:hypothetical protein
VKSTLPVFGKSSFSMIETIRKINNENAGSRKEFGLRYFFDISSIC